MEETYGVVLRAVVHDEHFNVLEVHPFSAEDGVNTLFDVELYVIADNYDGYIFHRIA